MFLKIIFFYYIFSVILSVVVFAGIDKQQMNKEMEGLDKELDSLELESVNDGYAPVPDSIRKGSVALGIIVGIVFFSPFIIFRNIKSIFILICNKWF